MSKIFYKIEITETQYNSEMSVINKWEENLPHADIIKNWLPKEWNNCHIEKTFDGVLKDNIASCTAVCKIAKENAMYLMITIEGIKGFRMSEKRKSEIWAQLDAQMSDGFGESYDRHQIPGAPKGYTVTF